MTMQRLRLLLGDVDLAASKHLLGRKTRQAAMRVLKVVPIEIRLAPRARLGDVGKSVGIIRLIFQRLKLAFAERIVVADARTVVTTGGAQFAHQIQIAARNHGRAAILMHGELSFGNRIARHGFLHQLPRQGAVFFARHHPSDDKAAVQVEYDVQGEIFSATGCGAAC